MHKLRDAHGDTEEGLRAQLEALSVGRKVYVLGLGNADRADDGAGVLVAEALKELFPSLAYSEQDGVEGTVLDISERDERAVVFFVDASDMGLSPGAIRVVRKEQVRASEITTHRVPVALMASVLADRGKDSCVICIQPGSLRFRGEVSPEVKEAVRVVTGVLARLMMRAEDREARTPHHVVR